MRERGEVEALERHAVAVGRDGGSGLEEIRMATMRRCYMGPVTMVINTADVE